MDSPTADKRAAFRVSSQERRLRVKAANSHAVAGARDSRSSTSDERRSWCSSSDGLLAHVGDTDITDLVAHTHKIAQAVEQTLDHPAKEQSTKGRVRTLGTG